MREVVFIDTSVLLNLLDVPTYPRTPYLWRDDGRRVNVVPDDEVRSWFISPVVVEEKLDGANVSFWLDSGQICAASRGGPDAVDRAGQLGRVKGWAAARYQQLTGLLGEGRVLYGEWLWMRHSTAYDRLPDWLIVLDVRDPAGDFMALPERDRLALDAGLTVPPRIFEGVLGSRDRLSALLGASRFGREPMEGLVIRRPDGARCKIVRPGFVRRSDDEWDPAARNALATLDDPRS